MSAYEPAAVLTDTALLSMLGAAVECATQSNTPQCIVIVDTSGVDLVAFRMSGSKFMSLASARAKAITAASNRLPSGSIPAEVAGAVASATGGKVTNLRGGLPIRIDGRHLGGIGIGSGSPEQDLTVARAALAAIGADLFDSEN